MWQEMTDCKLPLALFQRRTNSQLYFFYLVVIWLFLTWIEKKKKHTQTHTHTHTHTHTQTHTHAIANTTHKSSKNVLLYILRFSRGFFSKTFLMILLKLTKHQVGFFVHRNIHLVQIYLINPVNRLYWIWCLRLNILLNIASDRFATDFKYLFFLMKKKNNTWKF